MMSGMQGNKGVLKFLVFLGLLMLMNVRYITRSASTTMTRCDTPTSLVTAAADEDNNVPVPVPVPVPTISSSEGGYGGTCSALFPEFIPTTNSIWSSNLTRIAEATTDHELSFAFIAEMLLIASPLRLQLGVQTLPARDYEPVKRAIDIAYARYKYVQAFDLANTTKADEQQDQSKNRTSSQSSPPPPSFRYWLWVVL